MTADKWRFCYIEDINITNLLQEVEFPTARWLPIMEEISR